MFGHLFAFRLTVDRTEMSRREEAENQGNSGLPRSRRFEPMGLPFPKWSMLQEGGFKRAAFSFASMPPLPFRRSGHSRLEARLLGQRVQRLLGIKTAHAAVQLLLCSTVRFLEVLAAGSGRLFYVMLQCNYLPPASRLINESNWLHNLVCSRESPHGSSCIS